MDIVKKLRPDPSYKCPRCCGLARPIDCRSVKEVFLDGEKLDVVDSFCYLEILKVQVVVVKLLQQQEFGALG